MPTNELTSQDMARLMLGKTVGALSSRQVDASDRPAVARVAGLAGEGLEAVDLEVREGEIVALTGLPGSGFEAIPYLLTGARRATSGNCEPSPFRRSATCSRWRVTRSTMRSTSCPSPRAAMGCAAKHDTITARLLQHC